MGAWGHGPFDSDLALDARADEIEHLVKQFESNLNKSSEASDLFAVHAYFRLLAGVVRYCGGSQYVGEDSVAKWKRDIDAIFAAPDRWNLGDGEPEPAWQHEIHKTLQTLSKLVESQR